MGVLPTRMTPMGRANWRTAPPLPYDAEVQWVESDGRQYIDVGIPAGPNTRTETDLMVTDWDATTYALSGSAGSRHTFGKGYTGSSTGTGNAGKLYFGLGAQNFVSGTTLSGIRNVRFVYFVDATNATAGYGNTSFSLESAGTIKTNSYNAFLLAQNTATGVRGQMAARLYGFKWYESGALVRNFVPVRVGTAGALYDLANPTGGPSGNGLYLSAPATPLAPGPDSN